MTSGAGRRPGGVAIRTPSPTSGAASISEWVTLLPSPTYATVRPLQAVAAAPGVLRDLVWQIRECLTRMLEVHRTGRSPPDRRVAGERLDVIVRERPCDDPIDHPREDPRYVGGALALDPARPRREDESARPPSSPIPTSNETRVAATASGKPAQQHAHEQRVRTADLPIVLKAPPPARTPRRDADHRDPQCRRNLSRAPDPPMRTLTPRSRPRTTTAAKHPSPPADRGARPREYSMGSWGNPVLEFHNRTHCHEIIGRRFGCGHEATST